MKVVTYNSPNAYAIDLPKQRTHGYVPISVAIANSHVNAVRTLIKMLLLIGLFTGVSRSKPKVIVTYALYSAPSFMPTLAN